MKTKLFILLFATILGAVITGCNHQPEENSGASSNSVTSTPPPTPNLTNLAVTNSMGSVNVPSVNPASVTNAMTNNP